MESLNCQVTIGNNKVVEFHGVRNVYPTTGCEQINCYFTIPSQYRPEVGDFIGIYPVGWTSLVGHCLIKKYVKPENVWGTPAGQQYGKVEFDGEYLMQELQLNGGCIEQQQEQPKYYQFVYVRNGEYIRGASTPFMFVPTTTIQQQLTSTVEEIPSIFRQTPFGGMWSSVQQQQQPRQGGLTLGQVVEREMQKLQNGIFGLEQGLVGYKTVFPTIEETYIQPQPTTIISTTTGYPTNTTTTTVVQPQQQQPTPVEIMCEQWCQQQQQPFGGEWRQQQPYQVRKHWQSRIVEVQQMLGEQMRLEQAQRRIEQLNMLGQLRAYERHIQHVQRKEQEINEYLRGVKMQKQIAEFEQKVYNLIKLGEQQQQRQVEQPEYYVRKYEQLLREKVEFEIQKRQAIMHKLRQTVRECERKLREVQTGEQQHYQRYHQILKQRIGQQFEAKYLQPTVFQVGQYTLNVEWELREQLRQQVGQLIQEQRRELFQLIKAQKQMQFLCQEIACKLQELECQEIYSQLRIPRIPTTPYQQQYPQYEQHYTQVQQLEQQLFELKQTLRQKMIQQTIGLPTTTINATTLISVEWYKPIVQKLRELEWTLRQEKMIRQQEQQQLVELVGGQQQQPQQWYERRIQNLTQHLRYFERQVEQLRQPQQQQQFELKEVLCQLRQLEGELCEYPQFYQQYKHHHQQQQQQHFYQQQQQVVELCQYLQTIVREKLAQLTTIVGAPLRLSEQSPIVECFVQTGNHSAWKQMMQFERKLVQLKGMIVERQQYQQLQQRLAELEQYVQWQQQQPEGRWSVQRVERCQEQIRSLRQMLEQHQQQWQQQQWFQQQQLQQQLLNGCQYQQQPQPQQWQHWSVVPEQFVQHQQKYERLCQLVQELECQIVEQQQQPQQWRQQQYQQYMPSTMYVNVCGGQQQQQQLVGLNLIQQRFERLVQEFQQRIIFGQQQQQREFFLPEHVAQKVESIVQYLRNIEQQQVNKPYFGHQLREKICEFETILCEQPELVELVRQQQGWTNQQQQQQVQQFVRQACKQIRELKSQIQCALDDWVLISAEGPYGCEYVAEQCGEINNNQQLEKDLMCFLAGEQQQQQTVEQQLRQQLKQQFVDELVNGGLSTVGGKWMNQPTNYEQQQQQQRLAAQVERKLEQFERLFEQQQQEQQYESVEALYPIGGRQQQQQTTGTLRSIASVENLIGELETELVKLRLQKEWQPTITTTTPYTTTTRMVLNGQITPETVCEEITKLVGQTLLTTVVPTIVKGQQQQQDKQTTTTTQSTIVVEPTPFGGQAVKVQQRETTQQQQQQQF